MVYGRVLTWAAMLMLAGSGAAAQPATVGSNADKPQPAAAGAAKSAPDRVKAAPSGGALSEAEQKLLATLHRVNQGEIIAGEKARTTAESAEVKRYGERLAQDHRRMDETLLSLAKRRGAQLSALEPTAKDREFAKREQTLLNRLSTLRGADFDREFLSAMIDGHRSAIETIESARGDVKDAQVRNLLDKLVPNLRQHAQNAEKLSQNPSSTAASAKPARKPNQR